MAKKVYILTKQIYEEWEILGVFLSKVSAENRLEEIRIETEQWASGCWELGGWEQTRDWVNGGKYVNVRDGQSFKHWYRVDEHDLEE